MGQVGGIDAKEYRQIFKELVKPRGFGVVVGRVREMNEWKATV